MSFLDSFNGMSNAVPSNWADFQSQVQASQTFDQWMAEQQAAAERNGGDAGTAIRPDDYATSINYTLPGKQGNWTWDGGQYIQPDTPDRSWVTAGVTPVNVVHDDGTGNGNGTGVYYGKTSFDNSPTGWDRFLDIAMPLAVGAITGMAGGAAIGGWMGAGEGAAGAGAADAAGADSLTTGIGEGAYDVGAADAAPAFTYGDATAPAWSQSGGTELGSGFYGTDPGSMADLYGTTAGGADGSIGSGLGSGVAADAASPIALAGAADAGSGFGLSDLYDLYKNGSNIYKLGNAVSGLFNNPQTPTPTPGGAGALSQLFGSGSGGSSGGSGIGAGGIAAAVKGALGEAPVTDLTTPVELIKPAPSALQGGNFISGNNDAGDKLGGYAAWHAQHG